MKIKTAQDIAILIKTERKKQNLTQTELAGLCNVGLRFIVDIEKAKETYEFVTGDEWGGVEEAARWIAEEYEPPEVVESVHAR